MAQQDKKASEFCSSKIFRVYKNGIKTWREKPALQILLVPPRLRAQLVQNWDPPRQNTGPHCLHLQGPSRGVVEGFALNPLEEISLRNQPNPVGIISTSL
jgi:hypothetical protein